jgi:N-acetylneuraminate lyase
VQASAGRATTIIQVGHDSLWAAARLAAHAAQIGADAISAIPPHFFKIHSEEILLDSLAEISAAAPALPLYYYHIPRLTGVPIDVPRLLSLSVSRLPALVGVKYSDFKIFELQACVELAGGRFNILFGSDEMLLSGLAGGAQGAVGTTYSFAAPLYQRLIQAFHRGDLAEAQRLQSLSVQMVQIINHYAPPTTNLPPMKAIMVLVGLDCGPLRLPLPTLSSQQVESLQADLQAIGFFNFS